MNRSIPEQIVLLSRTLLLGLVLVPSLAGAQQSSAAETSPVAWYRGQVIGVDPAARMVDAQIGDDGQTPVTQRFLLTETALITVDGVKSTVRQLAAGQIVQVRAAKTDGAAFLADMMNACSPSAAGGSGGGQRSPIGLVTLAGGGGGGNRDLRERATHLRCQGFRRSHHPEFPRWSFPRFRP